MPEVRPMSPERQQLGLLPLRRGGPPDGGVVRQVSILHLPGVVEHVVTRVSKQVRDRPLAKRLALLVPRTHRLNEAVAVLGESARPQQVHQLGLGIHAPREVLTLVRQDVVNDLVTGAAAAPDTRPELCRYAGGRLVELGPRRAEQPHVAVERRRVERLAVQGRRRTRCPKNRSSRSPGTDR